MAGWTPNTVKLYIQYQKIDEPDIWNQSSNMTFSYACHGPPVCAETIDTDKPHIGSMVGISR